ITITASSNLSKDEVERMVRDAESSAAEDRRKKDEAEIRNLASSLIYSTEKSLKEVGDKLDPAAKGDVESALADLKAKSDNGTADEIKAATEKLQQASYKMAELLYQKTTAGAGAGTNASNGATAGEGASTSQEPAGPSEDVIDAEFKEAK
ncbi:MAG: Hsp70 family protein, partial [Vulcanimicrobiaceae bacterium]